MKFINNAPMRRAELLRKPISSPTKAVTIKITQKFALKFEIVIEIVMAQINIKLENSKTYLLYFYPAN